MTEDRAIAIDKLVYLCVENRMGFEVSGIPTEPCIHVGRSESADLETLKLFAKELGGSVKYTSRNYNDSPAWLIYGEGAYQLGKELKPILWKLQGKGAVCKKLGFLEEMLHYWRKIRAFGK